MGGEEGMVRGDGESSEEEMKGEVSHETVIAVELGE